MSNAIPVITSTLTWSSRLEAEEECRRILRNPSVVLGQAISGGRELEVMLAILEIHPNANVKRGTGVSFLFIGSNSKADGLTVSKDSIGFWIQRTDGTPVEYSYLESIYPSDQRRKVSDALRAAVRADRNRYKDNRYLALGDIRSDLSGEVVARADAVVILEQPAFAQLAFRFAQAEGGWDAIELSNGGSAAFIGDVLSDREQGARWIKFYNTSAKPGIATKSEAARRPKKIDETYWDPAW